MKSLFHLWYWSLECNKNSSTGVILTLKIQTKGCFYKNKGRFQSKLRHSQTIGAIQLSLECKLKNKKSCTGVILTLKIKT